MNKKDDSGEFAVWCFFAFVFPILVIIAQHYFTDAFFRLEDDLIKIF